MLRLTLILAALAMGIAATASAQAPVRERLRIVDSTIVQVVELRDGSRLVGRITSIADSTIQFRVSENDLTLRISDIDALQELPASEIREGGPWFVHPHQTNLVLGPTGRTLSRGQGYFTLHELFFATLNYGLVDHLTVGAGATLLPGLSLDEQILYFLPKLAVVRMPHVNVALGSVIVRAGDIFDISETGAVTFGVVYGAATIGGPDANLTTGLGYGFTGDRISSQPLTQLGGQVRIGSSVALITENWLIGRVDEDAYWLSWTGWRFLTRKATIDAAMMFAPQDGAWLPWIGVTFGF